MKLTRYTSAAEFLRHSRAPLEKEEAANSLIVGIAARVAEIPDYYGKYPVYLATVDEGDELLAAAVRTPPHNVILYGARGSDPEGLRLILKDIRTFHSQFPPGSPGGRVPGVIGHSAGVLAFAELWSQETGERFEVAMDQRIYELREVIRPYNVPGHLRPARDEELDLLQEWVNQFNVDCRLEAVGRPEARELANRYIQGGGLFVWEFDHRPVSMALRGRNSSHGITIGLVYTPNELRGRGYASACVAALSQQLLDAGWEFCSLYTDLANPTSNEIYQRIGYRPVCDSKEYHFVSD